MRNIICLCCLFIFLSKSQAVHAQTKSVPGFYVNANGDSIRGQFPGYAQWNKNPVTVDFVPAGQAVSLELTPANSLMFVVEDFDEYRSYRGKRLVNEISDRLILANGFEVEPLDVYEETSVFLRLLTRTNGADLYLLRDAKRINFFYQTHGGQVTELKYKKSYKGNKLTDIPEFRQQLYLAFKDVIDAKNLYSRLEKLKYSEKELVSFFESIFTVSGGITKRSNSPAEWFIEAGLVTNMVGESKFPSFAPFRSSSSLSLSPLASIGVMIPVDRKFGKYFLYPQLKLFRYKNIIDMRDNVVVHPTSYQADMVAEIQFGLGANLVNKKDLRLFASAAAGGFIQIDGKQVRKTAGNSYETKMNVLNYVMDASVGMIRNEKTSFTLTYGLPVTLLSYGDRQTHLSYLQFRLGYKFR